MEEGMSAMAMMQQNHLGGYQCSKKWGLLRADGVLLPRPAGWQLFLRGWGQVHSTVPPPSLSILHSISGTTQQVFTSSSLSKEGWEEKGPLASVFGLVLVEFIWISWRHPGECEPKELNNNPEPVRRAQIRQCTCFFFKYVCILKVIC